ncbi:MAG: hypothetical protein ACE5HY_06025 [Candidatus Hydrothermarchaeales archaeon]
MKNLTAEDLDYELCFPENAKIFDDLSAILPVEISKVCRSAIQLAYMDGIRKGLELCRRQFEVEVRGKKE